MTTIAVGTTQTTGYVASIDNSGNLVFQTNGTTTAMTLDTSQNANIVGSVTAAGANIVGNVSVTGTQFVNGVVTFANSTSNNFYFAANGNIGLLGNNTPVYSVDIAKNEDSAYTGVGIRNSNTGPNASARVVFFNDNTNAAVALTSSGVANAGYNRASTLSIHTSSTAVTGGISVAARTTGGYIDFYTSGNNQRLLIANTGDVMINTANNTSGGFNNKLIVKQTSESWVGGIGVEAASNDHILTIASDSTSHVIAASYKTLSGYRPLTVKVGNLDALSISTAGRVQMPYQICVQAGAAGGTYDNGTDQQHWGKTGYVFTNQGSAWNANTGVFTSPISATYLVKVSIRISSENYSASGNYNYIQLTNTNTSVNGTPILLWSPASYTGGTYRPWVLTAIMKLNANDTITPQLRIRAGGQLVVDGGTGGQTDDSLSIIQIG